MFIEALNGHLAVCSIAELPKLLNLDRNFWNVISIRSLRVPKPECLRHAKRFHEFFFEDREDAPDTQCRPPRREDVEAIFEFVDRHAGEPVLVHCEAGLSRSPAVALGLIVRGLVKAGMSTTDLQPMIQRGADLLLGIRRQSRPNALMLELCFEHFLPAAVAKELAIRYVNHPPLLANRARPAAGRSPGRMSSRRVR